MGVGCCFGSGFLTDRLGGGAVERLSSSSSLPMETATAAFFGFIAAEVAAGGPDASGWVGTILLGVPLFGVIPVDGCGNMFTLNFEMTGFKRSGLLLLCQSKPTIWYLARSRLLIALATAKLQPSQDKGKKN